MTAARARRAAGSRAAAVVLVTTLAAVPAACSASHGSASDGPEPAASDPAAAASEPVAHSLDDVSVRVPADFEPVAGEEVPGETRLQLASPPDERGARAAVVVLLVEEPEETAEVHSARLSRGVREEGGVEGVDRQRTTWHGAPAWEVRWKGRATDGSDVVLRSRSLVADLPDGRLVAATAQAPPRLYRQYELDAALPTVEVEGWVS